MYDTKKNANRENLEKLRLSEQNQRMEHILKILVPVVLGLQNFAGPLAFRIWNYTIWTPAGTILSEICRRRREISLFFWKCFPKIINNFSVKFALALSYKELLIYREKNLRLYKPYGKQFLGGECTRQGAEPPAGPKKITKV